MTEPARYTARETRIGLGLMLLCIVIWGVNAVAFKLCTNRVATAAEVDEILSLYKSQRDRVADGWLSPRAITTGNFEKLPELPKDVSPSDAAAWTIVARMLLNLDETLTKG